MNAIILRTHLLAIMVGCPLCTSMRPVAVQLECDLQLAADFKAGRVSQSKAQDPQKSVDDWITQLGTDSVPLKLAALHALMRMEPPPSKAIAAVRKIVLDKSNWSGIKVQTLRMGALHTLMKIDPEAREIVPTLVTALEDPDDDIVITACICIERLGKKGAAAVPSLIKLLDPTFRGLGPNRSVVVRSLGAIGSDAKEAIPAIRKAMEDKYPLVSTMAARSIWMVTGRLDEALPFLVKGLEDKGDEMRARAAFALGCMGSAAKGAVPSLVVAINDPDDTVQSNVAEALGNIGQNPDASIPALIRALVAKDSDVRYQAAKAIGQFGPAGRVAVPALLKSLNDDNPRVRKQAMGSLMKIDPDVATKAKKRRIKDAHK